MKTEQISITVSEDGAHTFFSPGCVSLEQSEQRMKIYVQGFEVTIARTPQPTGRHDNLLMLTPNPRLYGDTGAM